MKFIFDLDGTVTTDETLPIISRKFGISEKINSLTNETIKGNIPFIESFIRRVHILGEIPVSEINDLLAAVSLNENILAFIQNHRDDCVIATGNFGGWIKKLADIIGCQYFCSDGIVENNKITKLTYILQKEDVVKKFKGEKVVFIGDGNNDVEAMREADVSIACGLVHYPARGVLAVADYVVFDDKPLCRLLHQLYSEQQGKSIVLSCAGIGSRLGLGQTKALIKINNLPLIHWQLKLFEDFEDVRIVIGFQADDLIKTVLERRSDVIFVFNHNYFYTKTGASYYLGARHGNEYAIEWDGDLLVHPEDAIKCLNYKKEEFIACSETVTDEAVFVNEDENGDASSFSLEAGDYEWTGPACLKKKKIKYVSTNVFNQLEEYLPLPLLKIRAQDVDTYDDYIKANDFVRGWDYEK